MTGRARNLGLIALTALLLGGRRPAVAEPTPPEVFAVVVGWNGGTAELPSLRFADDDAVRFALLFSGLGTPERPGRTWLLTEVDGPTRSTLDRAGLPVTPDGPPTREAVLGVLASLAGELRRLPARPRVLYFVYAGHGLRGRVVLKPAHGAEAALSGAELRAALAEVTAAAPDLRAFVFLDACRSQSLFAERGPPVDQGPDLGAAIGELERRSRSVPIGVLTAARNGKPAGEVKQLEAGYFSHVLTSALAGAADADGDDLVTFGELAAFTAFHTQKLTGQMPWFEPPAGDLSAGAMDHRGRGARIIVPSGDAGRYLVGAVSGLPVFVEAFKGRGRALHLTLPPGRYRVRREVAGGVGMEAAVELRPQSRLDLAAVTWTEVDASLRGPADHDVPPDAREEALGFSSEFSPEVVSTLVAGFRAGREGPQDVLPAGHQIFLYAGAAPAPLGLEGLAPALTARYRRRGQAFAVGAVARAASSRHAIDTEAYRLTRLALGGEAGAAWRAAPRITLHAYAAGGWSALLRTAPSGTSGDLVSPWGGLGADVVVRLGGPWLGALSGRLEGTLVRIDGERELTGGPAIDLGLGVTF